MRSDRLRLQDILDAVAVVRQYLHADRAAFDPDPPLQSHILRHLMIIGEAAFKLTPGLKQSHLHIPWKQIEGMRHILVHDYFKVNWTRAYETARDHAPALQSPIEAILASLPQGP